MRAIAFHFWREGFEGLGFAYSGCGSPMGPFNGEDNVMTIMPAPDAQRQASVLALTRAADEAAWSDSPGPGAVVGVGLRVAGIGFGHPTGRGERPRLP